jgi:hypothetical protein
VADEVPPSQIRGDDGDEVPPGQIRGDGGGEVSPGQIGVTAAERSLRARRGAHGGESRSPSVRQAKYEELEVQLAGGGLPLSSASTRFPATTGANCSR